MSFTDLARREPASLPRWLSIVGIGEDGLAGLKGEALDAVKSAQFVFGGARHLALAASLMSGVPRTWPVPFDRTVAEVLALRGRAVVVLASGDPFLHGVGDLLARYVSASETHAFPTPSAFSLAASRLLWPLAATVSISLCGRPLDLIRPHLHPATRILAVTSDGQAPARIARLLCELGFGESQVTVLEALAGPRERVRTACAQSFDLEAIDPLNIVAIEVAAAHGARILARTSGLDDELFEHDGQLTKREIRALTLSALAPRRGQRLWDVGAGSGSVAIEWLLADASLSAIAVEQRADRAARIRRNAAAFGVPHLQTLEGPAPAALEGLTPPDAVFIGGGITGPGTVDVICQALRAAGRLVANAVTLEAETLLLGCHSRLGGSLTRIALSRAGAIGGDGRLSGWRPAMPVTQWTWVKR